MRNIYIAGKMRGEKCFNFEKFFYWAHVFRNKGWNPLNPAEHDCLGWINEKVVPDYSSNDEAYNEIIEFDLDWIEKEADVIFMMSGWEESPGAAKEHHKAKELGIEILYEDELRFEDNADM